MIDASQDEKFYWVAINGPSVAAGMFALPTTVKVTPNPEILIGFKTRTEQLETQRICLTASHSKVDKLLASLKRRTDVKWIEFANPEPPTRGSTMWSVNSMKV